MGDQTKQDHVIGVDFGGTKILTGVFSNSLELLGMAKVKDSAQAPAGR